MPKNKAEQLKRLQRLAKDKEVFLLDEIDRLEDSIPNLEKLVNTIKGNDGDKGEKGNKGETGARGEQGKEGKQGSKGSTGEKGATGSQGPKGDAGKPGEDGKSGKDGIDGKDGQDFTPELDKLAIDTINTLELLEGEDRLSARAIRGLEDFIQPFQADHFISSQVQHMADVDFSSVAKGDTLVWNSTRAIFEMGAGGGGVTPGTPLNSIQYNDNGSFAGSPTWSLDGVGGMQATVSGTLNMYGTVGPVLGNGEISGTYKMMTANASTPRNFGYDIDDDQFTFDTRILAEETFDTTDATASDSERSDFRTYITSSSSSTDSWYALRSRVEWSSNSDLTPSNLAGSAGLISSFSNSGTGTVSDSTGVIGLIENTSSGTITLGSSIIGVAINTGGGTIDKTVGFRPFSINVSGTINNSYGFYIPTGALAATTNRGLYFEQDIPSYHEGNFWIGSNSEANSKFHVATTSDANSFVVSKVNGRVGVGESSPGAKIHANSGSTNLTAIFESTDTIANIEIRDPSGSAYIVSSGGNRFSFGATSAIDPDNFNLDSGGFGSFGRTSADRRLHVEESTGSPQVKLSYDNSNSAQFYVNPTGDLEFITSGGHTYNPGTFTVGTTSSPADFYVLSTDTDNLSGSLLTRNDVDMSVGQRYQNLLVNSVLSDNSPHASAQFAYFEMSGSYAGTGTLNKLYGSYYSPRNTNTGTIQTLTGSSVWLRNTSTGTVDDMIAYEILSPTNAGTITNAVTGVQIKDQGLSGVTNTFGIDIEDQTTSTNPYAIRTGLGMVELGDNLLLSAYGSGSITGTPTYNLSVDTNGNVIETPLGGQGTYIAKTANYTASSTDVTIDCTANTFTVTLPTAVGITGRIYNVHNSGTGVITLDGDGTETINGSTTQTINQYETITVQSNGANWIII